MDRKIFITLFFCIFAAITGVGIVVPLLPVYARELGASHFLVGCIFGSFSLSRATLMPLFGKFSDLHGRKPFIAAGLFFYMMTAFAFMFAENVYALIGIRFFHGAVSAMVIPVVFAYVGEISPMGKEGMVMGIFNLSMYLSLSLGPLLGGVVMDWRGLDTAFWMMAALTLVALALSLFLLPPAAKEPRNRAAPLQYRVLVKNRVIMGVAVFRVAYTVCIGAIWAFLPVYGDAEFGLSATRIGLLITAGVAVSGFLQIPMGWMADRVDKRAMVVLGGMLIAGAMAWFVFAGGFWGLMGVNVLFGLGGAVSMPALMAISVREGKKTGSMGSVMALLTMGHSLGMFLGSMSTGLAMDAWSPAEAYALGAVVALGGTLFFLVFTRQKKTGGDRVRG